MEKELLVYVFALTIILAMIIFINERNNAAFMKKKAKIRVFIDDRDRRHIPDPNDEDYNPQPSLELILLAAGLLFLVMLLGLASQYGI